jgi:hypothetical protein
VLVLISLLAKLGSDDGVGGGGEEVAMVRVKRWLDQVMVCPFEYDIVLSPSCRVW